MDPAHEALRAKAVEAIEALREDAAGREVFAAAAHDWETVNRYGVDVQVYDVAIRTIRGRAHK